VFIVGLLLSLVGLAVLAGTGIYAGAHRDFGGAIVLGIAWLILARLLMRSTSVLEGVPAPVTA